MTRPGPTAVAMIVLVFSLAVAAVADRPNVLVMVSDNQGWKDIGYNGSEIRTPNLDGLSATGVRLDRYHVYPMCSPTRVGFVSGRAPSRYGILGAIGHRSLQALPPETTTVADVLVERGYETAIIGKWHLGLRPEVGPLQYGFQSSYGFLHGQIDKRSHRYKNGDRTWHRNDRFVEEAGHSLDLIAAAAVRFIERKREKPFFLYVPFGAPHPPLQDDEKWVRPYEGVISEESRRLYAAAITHMDAAVGDLIAALDRCGQRRRTIVVFFSDNGAIQSLRRRPQDYGGRFGPYPVLGDNGPLRGWIGELHDGCLRTPAFVNWPGMLAPAIVTEVTSVLDWFPTLVGLAGGTIDTAWKLEGRDIWPLLTGAGDVPGIALYWKTVAGVALRDGQWKLVDRPRQGITELFRIDVDPYERTNVAEKYPDEVRRLRALLERHAALDS